LFKITTDLAETGREAVTGFIWLRIEPRGGLSYVGYLTTLSVSRLSSACGTVDGKIILF
jgi:hypothetical protein